MNWILPWNLVLNTQHFYFSVEVKVIWVPVWHHCSSKVKMTLGMTKNQYSPPQMTLFRDHQYSTIPALPKLQSLSCCIVMLRSQITNLKKVKDWLQLASSNRFCGLRKKKKKGKMQAQNVVKWTLKTHTFQYTYTKQTQFREVVLRFQFHTKTSKCLNW